MTTTFLDRPVQGEINISEEEVEQYDEARFGALMNRVLASDRVVALGWTQYTPYFNDGDPCIFNSGPIQAAVEGEMTYFRTGYRGDKYEATTGEWGQDEAYGVDVELIRPDAEADVSNLYEYDGNALIAAGDVDAGEALTELNKDIRHYYRVLRSAFGDHAIVVAFRDHFVVETYEHD